MEHLRYIFVCTGYSAIPAAILTALICGIQAWILKGAYGQRLLERARQRGHAVAAKKSSDSGKRAVYRYIWKEKTYRCRPLGANEEQLQTLELYFQRSPARACTAKKLGRFRPWLVFLCIELAFTTGLVWMVYEVMERVDGL